MLVRALAGQWHYDVTHGGVIERDAPAKNQPLFADQRANIGTRQRPGRRHESRDLAIVAVDGEGHGDDRASPARNQEDVRAPALIARRLLVLPRRGAVRGVEMSSSRLSSRASSPQ